VEYQLRHYKIRAGELERFVVAWREGVRPLRERFGFAIVGAWRLDGADEFVWILAYEGLDSFAEADRRYYASDERKRLTPDPAQYIESPVTRMMRSVLG
jgi:hypothetical protein